MVSCRAPLLSGAPQVGGESGFCMSSGERSIVSFEEVSVFFTEQEWALLDPGQRKLFWEVTEENYETTTSLGAEGKIWNVEFHRASLLSSFPQLEEEFGFCTSAGKRSSVSFCEEVMVVIFTEEEEWSSL
ncbi:zinc finger protein 560-like [Sphaerodactylus townsendi]|uniref:zinc finger protein 560-like n=1 Tax=Sphaerodactylus townsendi TaxID=933632 RepID=UPI002026E714|nr:zinc finger protein 560-like [Sphaerodactylus townsendi]